MNATLVKALVALVPVGVLVVWSSVTFARLTTLVATACRRWLSRRGRPDARLRSPSPVAMDALGRRTEGEGESKGVGPSQTVASKPHQATTTPPWQAFVCRGGVVPPASFRF